MAENPSDLVGKEFIFEYGVDRIYPPSEETGGLFTTKQRAYRRERVVRCRDCGRAYRRGGGGVYCSRVLQWGSNDRPVPLPVEPNGFCAWGERRGA